MARRKSLDEPQTPPPFDLGRRVRRWLLQLIGLLMIVGIFLAGLIWFGKYARDLRRTHERFQVAFADIECQPPSPLQREEFLDQVQYYGELPKQLSCHDPGLAAMLKEKFALHPWVAKVEAVTIEGPNVIRVTLAYRQPVLAVVVSQGLAGRGFDEPSDKRTKLSVRAVDGMGVLLPKKMPLSSDLPVLHVAQPPAGGEGKPWGDPGVAMAAETAARLKPHCNRFGITAMSWTDQCLHVWTSKVMFLWGSPSEGGKSTEATADVKERRLLQALAIAQLLESFADCSLLLPPGLWMHECDVRAPDAVHWRCLARETASGFR